MSTKSAVRPLLTAGWLLLILSTPAMAGVKVIANPSVKENSITVEELRGIYLLQRSTLKSGSRVVPVLQKGGTAHDVFIRQYLGRDAEEIRIYYQGLIFTGKGSMPKELLSDAEVVAYVSGRNGAIGYVSSETDTVGVKVLTILRPGQTGERTLLSRVEPEYPETLRKLRIGGSVRLQLTISPQGEVESVVVVGGNPIFVEVAVKAAKQWVYAPWPSQTTVEVSIPFQPRP
ncbi:MAG TPA: TonB family protein [Candidatus Sulfotelmatobacter sp.]|nr:TonB family protein [Candidatus Sulfotelmatobacter sp.]